MIARYCSFHPVFRLIRAENDLRSQRAAFISRQEPGANGIPILMDRLPGEPPATDEEAPRPASYHAMHPLPNALNARERKFVELYFGLDETRWTLRDIANRFGVTQERIRQIRDASLEKLRNRDCSGRCGPDRTELR